VCRATVGLNDHDTMEVTHGEQMEGHGLDRWPLDEPATAITRVGFEYRRQKCSAASRIFVPQSWWSRLGEPKCDDIVAIHMGDLTDFKN
jgi:acyl-CoA reductase-like NAD-dependent aldehyde dehydrogenase